MRVHPLLLGALFACGGVEPPAGPVAENVSLLVRDEFLTSSRCDGISALGIEAQLEVTGVLGACRVRVKEDGMALSICDRIPGKKLRDLELSYFVDQKTTMLALATVTASIDLTEERREMVEVDFTYADRELHDADGDGIPSFEELCVGRNPHVPGE